MHMFWEKVIKPIFIYANIKNIVEIGIDTGINTKKLIEYSKLYNGRVTAIDPRPQIPVSNWVEKHRPYLNIVESLSLHALPSLSSYDAVLIDGDHNWYTVYHELKQIENGGKQKGRLPLIFLHDTEWPYGRRDMYYVPETIPIQHRRPYAKKGMVQGNVGLVNSGGANSDLYNAVNEGGSRNGVLTAVEDFLRGCSLPYNFYKLHSNFGLGIITPRDPRLEATINMILPSCGL